MTGPYANEVERLPSMITVKLSMHDLAVLIVRVYREQRHVPAGSAVWKTYDRILSVLLEAGEAHS